MVAGYADSTDAITDGGVDLADIGQNGATPGDVIKWNGSAWTPQVDQGGGAEIGDTANVLRGEMGDTARAIVADTATVLRQEMGDSARTAAGDTAFVLRTEMSDSARIAAGDTAAVLRGERGWVDDGTVVRLSGSSDSVGIGTTTPTARLDVAGNIHASGAIKSGLSLTINGNTGTITSSSGAVSFGSDTVRTEGPGQFGPSHTLSGQGTFASGSSHQVAADWSAALGGQLNQTWGSYSAVVGGLNNRTNGIYSAVTGGQDNLAFGENAVVLGGSGNIARNKSTVALGSQARANHDATVVIAANTPATSGDTTFTAGPEQVVIRADGGIYITNTAVPVVPYQPGRPISTSTGAYLSSSGQWKDVSDSAAKEHFTEINREELLQRLNELPVTRWNFKDDPTGAGHIGPTAQDFQAAFGIGDDDKTIAATDGIGVALAAIQQLYRENRRLQQELETLKAQLEELRQKE